MRFGIHHSGFAHDGAGREIMETLRRSIAGAEECGFDSYWLSDHVHQYMRSNEPMLEPWTTLPALAMVSSRIRLGTMVTSNAFRHPSLLAKISATFDVISDGRLFFGIGASNYQAEADSYGIPFPPNAERLRRLDEAVQVIKLMWTRDVASFEGRFYRIEAAQCNPKPIQRPHPPILIGGEGESIALRIVARHADASNTNGGSPKDVSRKLEVLRKHCHEIGRDYSSILKTRTALVAIDRDREAVKRRIVERVPDSAKRESIIFGGPEDVISRIGEYRDAGIEYLVCIFESDRELEAMRVFADTVSGKV